VKPISCEASLRFGDSKRLIGVSGTFAALALALLLLPESALAIGFGEFKLKSSLGQPVAAEIDLIGVTDTLPEGECFRLVPGSELETGYPWLHYGRLTLQRIDGKTKLLLSSTQPLWEPIIEIGVQVGCGIELSRRYTVFPAVAEPTALPEAVPESFAATAPKPTAQGAAAERQGTPDDWVAAEGESVRTLARKTAPSSGATRLRMIAAIGAANPDLRSGGKDWYKKPLPAGTHVKIPDQSAWQKPPLQPAKIAAAAKLGGAGKAALTEAAPPAKAARPAKKETSAGTDKLVLGSSPAAQTPGVVGSARERELVQRAEEMKTTMQRQDEELAAAKSRMQQLEQQLTLLGDRAKMLDERLTLLKSTPPTLPAAPATPVEADSGLGVGETVLLAFGLVGLAGTAVYYLRRRRGSDSDADTALARLSERRSHSGDKNKDITVLDPFDDRATLSEGEDDDIAVVHLSGSGAMAKAVAKAKSVQAGAGKTTLSLDEEDAVVELADVLLSLSMSAHAVETLVAYIEANPKKAITPWLKLMKMYRETDQREDFDRLAGEIMAAFNVDRITWEDFDIGSNNAGIEQYQHIEKKLTSCWGTDECLQYLKHLLADNREGTRAGFPMEVVNEILMLIGVLKTRDTVLG
jgi:Tfp pilus assembly protein FimV